MGIFTRMAVNSLMSTSHPELDRKQCWNLRPHRDKCSRCMDICPNGGKIFKKPGVIEDWTSCDDCGLCVSACRTRCIAPSQEQIDRDTAPADSNNETVWIGCDRSTRQNDYIRECVGTFSWELLAFLALNKKLVLDLSPCGECENDACADNLRRSLERLVDFFGERVFENRISLAYSAEDCPYTSEALSRRELMERATDKSKNSTRRLLRKLPGMEEEGRGHEMDYRLLLNTRVKLIRDAASVPIHYGFYLPVINDKCFGCGKCERACKAGALKLNTGEDGLTRVTLTPWKCSECGQCVKACMSKAMEPELALRQVTTLGPLIIHKFKQYYCSECGKPVQKDCPDGICKVCEIRRRTKQRAAEAAERVKKRKEELAAKAAEEAAQKALEGGEAAVGAVTEAAPAVAAAAE